MNKKVIAVLSGGLDSTVAISKYKDYEIHCITFDYGQKAVLKEIESSHKICESLNAEHTVIKLDWLKKISNSSLTSSNEVPKLGLNDLEDQDKCEKSAKSVWVPARNTVFVSIATSFAEAEKASKIVVGWDAEEANTFPDNSKRFLNQFNELIKVGSPNNIIIEAPAIDLNKKEIVELGFKLNAPMELSYSCYVGNDLHCGVCESCLRRRRAFKEASIDDPTIYEKR
ncbi:7-cyano-7-deazaguanine synthase QueC [Methanobrevibacter sp. DSM 116169]|uniref:7-cyano-7-deazaguanine synthase QueC n=1 Tax=Methanobrevibacter sp. DSM 116169 TaxID=3242727 RepID=UPI0038FC28B0